MKATIDYSIGMLTSNYYYLLLDQSKIFWFKIDDSNINQQGIKNIRNLSFF